MNLTPRRVIKIGLTSILVVVFALIFWVNWPLAIAITLELGIAVFLFVCFAYLVSSFHEDRWLAWKEYKRRLLR